MRATWIAASAALVLILSSAVWLRVADADAAAGARVVAALDDLASAENALLRHVLSARSGLLRNYDPIVADQVAIRQAAERVRLETRADADGAATAAALAPRIAAQEELTERFKSADARLRNSLAHFSRLSERLDGAEPVVVRSVNALATAVLRLVQDPSARTDEEVRDAVASMPDRGERSPTAVAALLAHAGEIRALLPENRATLRALAGVVAARDVEALRARFVARLDGLTRTAGEVRRLVYAVALVLVALLVRVGMQLRSRMRALRRRAGIEHVVAKISARFLDTPSWKMDEHLALAVEELAACFGARRASFLRMSEPPLAVVSTRDAAPLPVDWFARAIACLSDAGWGEESVARLADVARCDPRLAAQARAIGIRSWLAITRVDDGAVRTVLGFDSDSSRAFRSFDADALLAVAFDALMTAVSKRALDEERERLERNLEQARRMGTIGAFASGIAHNFNNIVGAILGHAEMAETAAAPGSRLAQHVAAINLAGQRARDLVDQVLSFGRQPGAGSRRVVRLDELVAETVALLRTSLPANVRVVLPPSSAPVVALAHPAQLQQIVLNLCRNAAQALDGAGTVEVSTGTRSIPERRRILVDDLGPGEFALLTVEDDGRGMDEATLERIFEPFFTTRAEGNGLGLATALEIARSHGGTIGVESTKGRGTRFEVWLAAGRGSVASDRAAEGVADANGETVLVLEGDEGRRFRLEDVLAAIGYEPVGFPDIDAALAACRTEPSRFDAALVCELADVARAATLARALRQAAPSMPVVVCIGSTTKRDAEVLAHAGVGDVLHHSPTPLELAVGMATVLAAGARRPASAAAS